MTQHKDVVQLMEYQTYLDETPELLADIDFFADQPVIDMPFTFQAHAQNNCVTNVTYNWLVDSVSILSSNSASFQHTFAQFKDYQLRLEVSSPGLVGKVVSTTTIHPEPEDLELTLKTVGADTIFSCDVNSFDRLFDVINVRGCYDSLDYSWYYKLDAESTWNELVNEIDRTLTFDISEFESPATYQIKSIVNATCYNQDSTYSEAVSGQAIAALIHYINDEPCQ